MPRKTPDIEKKICEAALKLATTKPWLSLTLEHIAKTAKMPTAQVTAYVSSTHDVAATIVRSFDNAVTRLVGKSKMSASPHDRLFEIIMARLDLLQTHRAAILNIMDAAKRSPPLTRTLLSAQWHTMTHIQAIAGLTVNGTRQPLVTTGLLSIYGLTLCVWQRDQSTDMAKTMAALDRYLGYTDKLAAILLPNK